MPLDVVLLPCRTDNYAVLLRDPGSGETAVVDTPDGAVIDGELSRRGWKLDAIWTTHHHGDHTAGHEALKAKYGAKVIAPAAEASQTPAVDDVVRDGSTFRFGGEEVRVLSTPGHTKGHVSFHLPAGKLAFVGDTLFALGCGRLLEDGPEAMWASLRKLAALPDDTAVYCGHEYTQSNARFAVTVDPDNAALRARAAEIDTARAKGEPTIPTTIGLEKRTNPFLRAGDPAVKRAVGLESGSDVAVFAELRSRKDRF